ncbi:MAG: hypothetical protein V2J24_16260 [Pseudomonadales bacterium]|nr:hypothetical protein [Pseudomonadales bacterium]
MHDRSPWTTWSSSASRCWPAVAGSRGACILPASRPFLARLLCALIVSVGAPAQAEPASSPFGFDASIAGASVDNVSQAERGRDIVADEFAEAILGASYTRTLMSGRVDASLRGFLQGREQREVTGLGHYGGGVEISLDTRLTSSPLPPFLRIGLRAEGQDFDFTQRDSDVYTGTVELGTNIGPRAVVSVGGEYRDRQARSEVFDLTQWSAFLGASVDLGSSWQLDARAAYVDGDVWSTARVVLPNGDAVNDIFDLIAAAEVIQRDDAFNDAFDGTWFVYRLPAESQEYSLVLSRTLGQRANIAFEWVEVRIKGERDNDYDNRVLRLSLGFRI